VSIGWGPHLTLQNKQLLLLLLLFLLVLNLIIRNGCLSLMVHKQDEHSKYYLLPLGFLLSFCFVVVLLGYTYHK
jgi:hypothetical protein